MDELSFEALRWVSNQNKTRWFLVLKVRKPADNSLNLLLGECNGIASSCSQPQLYQSLAESASKSGNPDRASQGKIMDASDFFHFSIAWSLSAPPKQDGVESVEHQQLPDCVQSLRAGCEGVKVKIGNTVTSIMFGNSQNTSNSLLG